jgi:hypothetical protein
MTRPLNSCGLPFKIYSNLGYLIQSIIYYYWQFDERSNWLGNKNIEVYKGNILKLDLEEREFRFELNIRKKSIEMYFNKKIEEIDSNILLSKDKLKR